MSRMTFSERVLAKCVECGDCLIWKGAWASEGTTPAIYFDGRSANVRSALWQQMGKKVPHGHTIKAKCGEPACVAPAHLVANNYRAIPKTPTAKAITTRSMRARSKLTEDIVAQIRASDDRLIDWAQRLDVSISTISAIRLHKKWVPTNSMFSALIKPQGQGVHA
jgi:hypothetical protein